MIREILKYRCRNTISFKAMRYLLFCLVISLSFGYHEAAAQCNFIIPPSVKKVNYANREVTFSNVTMNGNKTTYLSVQKGEKVKISTTISSRKNGNYCPNCIVQIYWGIRGFTSVCAKSFHGYQFSNTNSRLKFKAPLEDGIYYITMGATLDYSCKNNNLRPTCSANDAFAVLKVGNPVLEKKIALEKADEGASRVLRTSLVKSGCFMEYGGVKKIEWFLDNRKLPFDNKEEIPLGDFGTYKVVWSSCLESIEKSIEHKKNKPSVPERKVLKEDDISTLVKNNEKFVLENLIFDLSRWEIKLEAQQDLDKLAEIMKDNPSMRILLEGHTDKIGKAKQNMVLSEKRVNATKDYLVSQGVPKANIETKGWGDKKPLIVTSDIEKGEINRRVEVSILSR